jgi:hypothetical protein
MEISMGRMLGALILLLGVSFFAISVYTNQLKALTDMLKIPFHLYGT